jgi:hypothetical protein
MTDFPGFGTAERVVPGPRRLYVGAYGFEPRAKAWAGLQEEQGTEVISGAVVIDYKQPKGVNDRVGLQSALSRIGATRAAEVPYEVPSPYPIEDDLPRELKSQAASVDEVVVDTSAMTKLLILATLSSLEWFEGTVRIVYAEASQYAPSKGDYEESKENRRILARFPSQGVQTVVRLRCLTSIRMQGQPVTMVAFTSFNERLVPHMLGTLSPHRLLFIGSRPVRDDFAWRERAMQQIHGGLIEMYRRENPVDDDNGLLKRAASTLQYAETVKAISSIYEQHGLYERVVCAATGSKMQTVGLYFAKKKHPDIHIEYPTPDTYFHSEAGEQLLSPEVHEVVVPGYKAFVEQLHRGADV